MDPSIEPSSEVFRCVGCGGAETPTYGDLCNRCFGRMTICPFCEKVMVIGADHFDCWHTIELADKLRERERLDYAAYSSIEDLRIASTTGLIRDIVLLDRVGKRIDVASKEKLLRGRIDTDGSKEVSAVYPFITIASGRWAIDIEKSHVVAGGGYLFSLENSSTPMLLVPKPPKFFECATMQSFDARFLIDLKCRELSKIRARWPTTAWQLIRYGCFSTPHDEPVRRSTREMSVASAFERNGDFYWTNIQPARTNDEMRANLAAANRLGHRTRFSPLVGRLEASFLPRLNGRFAIAIVPEIVRPQVDLDNDRFDSVEREATFSPSLHYFAAASDSLNEIAQMRRIGRSDRFRSRLEVEIDQRTEIFFHSMPFPDASYVDITEIIARSGSPPDGRKLVRCLVSVTFDGVLVADAVDFG